MRSSTRRTSLLHMCCIICRLKIRSVGPGSRAREATSACTCGQTRGGESYLIHILFIPDLLYSSLPERGASCCHA